MLWLSRPGSIRAALTGLVLALALGLLAASAQAGQLTIKATVGTQFSGELANVELENTEASDCTGDAHEASGVITWGDGEQSEITGSEFVFEKELAVHLNGAHTYGQAGHFEGKITGKYKCLSGEEAYKAKFSAEVKNTFAKETGVEFSEVVSKVQASQCSQNSSSPSGTIEWGDGESSPAVLSATPPLGTYLVTGKHTYLKPGIYKGRFTGAYKCNGGTGTGNFAAAVFTAEITGTEKPPAMTTTTPPPPPPQVHAAFAVQSVTPGTAVLDAAASVPAGASALTYSWNVTGGSQPDAVCQGSEPALTVHTEGALDTNVSLTATDAATGANTLVSEHLQIPAPTKPALTGKIARAAAIAPRVSLKGAVTPAFKMIGTCTGTGLPFAQSTPYRAAVGLGKSALTTTLGGRPSAECLEETEFGAADIQGCLGEVPNLQEIPGGITVGLSKLLCGTKLEQFCMPALSALGGTAVSTIGNALDARASSSRTRAVSAANISFAQGQVEQALGGTKFPFYFATGAVRIDGLDFDPQPGSPLVIVPSADLVFGLNIKVYLHNIPIVQMPALILRLPDVGGSMGELKLPKSVPIIGSLPFTCTKPAPNCRTATAARSTAPPWRSTSNCPTCSLAPTVKGSTPGR